MPLVDVRQNIVNVKRIARRQRSIGEVVYFGKCGAEPVEALEGNIKGAGLLNAIYSMTGSAQL